MPEDSQEAISTKMERLLHGVLLVGAVVSIALFVVGLAIALSDSSIMDVKAPISFDSMVEAMSSMSAIGIIGAGVIVLVATPIIRILSTIFYFVPKDKLLTLIPVIVMILIILGFLIRIL